MKLKNQAIVAIALLGLVAGSAQAGVHVRYQCDSTVKGKCPPPPVPPVPPMPPTPPAPPAPPGDDLARLAPPAPPAMPAMPTIAAPPAPPEPPAMPEVPAAAHAACAGKAAGTRLTHVLRKGETMRGVCEREDGKSVFQLREYRIHD
ncbi:hypothetical protein IM543_17460 [Massilia sp. UMI-21]|nr:hypothetical protein IM543_17460 [Massilia sp. UMI-21]